jgi:hypothetical protein
MLIEIKDFNICTRLGNGTDTLELGGHSSVLVSDSGVQVLVEEGDRLIAEVTIPLEVLRVALAAAESIAIDED